MRARSWLTFVLASALFYVALWIVIPGPIYSLFALSVAAREISAWLLVVSAVVAAVAAVDLRRRRIARLTLSLVILASAVSALPLVQAPAVARRFDAAMRTALGDDFLRDVPPQIRAGMRSDPLVIADLLRGLDAGAARVTDPITFAAYDGNPLTIIVYRPSPGHGVRLPLGSARGRQADAVSTGPFPTVVQIYGGAWRAGRPGESETFARYLASHGYVVFAIDYRHAPRWRWPVQLEDVRSALAWIRIHAAEHDADANRLALVGRSAGAHLAMLAAYEPGAAPVRAVVDFYGPTDLADGYRHPPRPDPLGVRGVLAAFIGGTPDELPAAYANASPVSYATRRLPPTLLIHGACDHVVEPRFSVMLNDRLRATGTTSVLLEIPWAEHAFDAVPNGPSAQLALYYTERFLAWALNAH